MRTMLGAALVLATLLACRRDEALVYSKVDTSAYDGEYVVVSDTTFEKMKRDNEAEPDQARRAEGEAVLKIFAEQYANFRIRDGVIRSGTSLVQEFSLKQASIEGGVLRGTAVWHEDVGDPGDMSDIGILLRHSGGVLEFSILDSVGNAHQTVYLKRKG